MAKPPERLSVSLPYDSELDRETIDEIVEDSECESRSELIRELLAERGELADHD